MNRRRYSVLDVFTDTPLEGNPLAVFHDALDLPKDLMQSIARELNLSETVFLGPDDAGADAAVRIFTPTLELPFAGHPILGSAFVVGASQPGEMLRLRTPGGIVEVTLRRAPDSRRPVWGEMRQPMPEDRPAPNAAAVLKALGTPRATLPLATLSNGPTFTYVALPEPADVAALRPDQEALGALGQGFSCFAPLEGANAFHVRVFVPGAGVPEDPATGSAAGPLAVHLLRNRVISAGETIRIEQGVEIGRPSTLHARIEGTPTQIQAVYVSGSAVPVAEGEFHLG